MLRLDRHQVSGSDMWAKTSGDRTVVSQPGEDSCFQVSCAAASSSPSPSSGAWAIQRGAKQHSRQCRKSTGEPAAASDRDLIFVFVRNSTKGQYAAEADDPHSRLSGSVRLRRERDPSRDGGLPARRDPHTTLFPSVGAAARYLLLGRDFSLSASIDHAGGFIQLKSIGLGFLGGAIGPCPPAQEICSGLGCPGDCSGSRRASAFVLVDLADEMYAMKR